LKGIPADLYLTGEMLHHEILDAVHCGTHVVLTNHSDSERGFLKIFASILDRSLQNSVKVCVSQADRDPLQTVWTIIKKYSLCIAVFIFDIKVEMNEI